MGIRRNEQDAPQLKLSPWSNNGCTTTTTTLLMDINKGLLPRQYKARTSLLGSIRRRNSCNKCSSLRKSKCSSSSSSTLVIVSAAIDECFQLQKQLEQQQQCKGNEEQQQQQERRYIHIQSQRFNHQFGRSGLRRVVRFGNESQNQIIPSDIILTQEDIDNSWWSVEESLRTKRDLSDTITEFMIQTKQQQLSNNVMTDFVSLVHLCMKKSGSNCKNGESFDDETTKEALHLALRTIGTDMSTVSSTSTPFRGLEIDLAPIVKALRKHHTKAVLTCYKKLSKEQQQQVDTYHHQEQQPEDDGSATSMMMMTIMMRNRHRALIKDRMLATRSMQFSRPLRLLAQVIGQMDEIVAA